MTQLLSDNHFVGEDAHLMGGAFTALTPAFLQPSSPASENTPSPCTDHADSHEGIKPHPVEKVPASQHEEPPVPPVQTLLTAMDLMSLPCWWRNMLPSRSRSRPTQPSLFFYHYNTNNIQIFNIFLLIFKPITTRISFPLNYILSNSSATCTPTVATKPVSSSAVFPTDPA